MKTTVTKLINKVTSSLYQMNQNKRLSLKWCNMLKKLSSKKQKGNIKRVEVEVVVTARVKVKAAKVKADTTRKKWKANKIIRMQQRRVIIIIMVRIEVALKNLERLEIRALGKTQRTKIVNPNLKSLSLEKEKTKMRKLK